MSSELTPSLLNFGRASRTNPAQWSVMVDFFIDHPEMVTRSFTGLDARQNYLQLWQKLATTLNSMGYGSKSAEKWIDAFTKWKNKVKTKAQAIRLGIKKTGGGAPSPPLTPIEEKLMGIIGWTIVEGDGTPELGLDNTQENLTTTSSLEKYSSALATCSSLTAPAAASQLHQTETERTSCIAPLPLAPLSQKRGQKSNVLEDHTYNTDEYVIETPTENSNIAPLKTNGRKRKKGSTNSRTNIPTKKTDIEKVTLFKMHQETMAVLKEKSLNIGRLADGQSCKNCKCKCTN